VFRANAGRSQLTYWQRVQTLHVSESTAFPQPKTDSFAVSYGTVLVAFLSLTHDRPPRHLFWQLLRPFD